MSSCPHFKHTIDPTTFPQSPCFHPFSVQLYTYVVIEYKTGNVTFNKCPLCSFLFEWDYNDSVSVKVDATTFIFVNSTVRSGGRAVERWTVNRGDGFSIPPTAVSKLRQLSSPHICLCLSEETLKAGDPFYLVFMLWGIKYPTQGVYV